MGFFGSKSKQAINNTDAADGSGFLHPESSLSSNRDLDTSSWTKERTSQQLELEDVHTNNKTSCCRKAIEFLVKSLFIIDISFGITMIVYGSLILTQFDNPAMATVLFNLILGSIHLSTSLLGTISLFMKGCQRYGLIITAYVGPYIALVYFTIVIALLADSNGLLQYLDDNHSVLYLSPNVAENCRKLLPLFYTILIFLGIFEASRFCVLLKLQERLVQHDVRCSLIPHQSGNDTYGGESVVSGNKSLTEALLDDTEEAASIRTSRSSGGGRAVERETADTPNWWEK